MQMKKSFSRFFLAFLCCAALAYPLAGCAAAEEEEPLSECRDAEEITELLYASNDRDRYFNYGFPVTEESVEDALKTGSRYGRVDSEEFQALSQIQEYFLEVYTEDYCEKL